MAAINRLITSILASRKKKKKKRRAKAVSDIAYKDKDHPSFHPIWGCVSDQMNTWPDHYHNDDPRVYRCGFCQRQFRCAQALGGHMNVHRRDRAFICLQQQYNHTLYGSCPPTPSLPSSSCISHPTSEAKGPNLPINTTTTPINSCCLPRTNNGGEPSSRTVGSSSSLSSSNSYNSDSAAHRYIDFFRTSSFSGQSNPSASTSPIRYKLDASAPAAIHVDLELRLGYIHQN